MASGIDELLDMLFEMIDEAKNAAFSGDKCVIERDKALDLLDDIRAQLPMELAEARKMVATRTEYLDRARREADAIRQQAQADAERILAADELAVQARKKGNEVIQKAEERSRELRRAANEYCDDVMRRTEEAIAEAHTELKNARARFHSAASAAAENQPTRPNVNIDLDIENEQS